MLHHIWKEMWFSTQLLTHRYLGISLGHISWQLFQMVLSFGTEYQGDFSCICHDSANYYNLAIKYFPLVLKRVKITSEIPNSLLRPSAVSKFMNIFGIFFVSLNSKSINLKSCLARSFLKEWKEVSGGGGFWLSARQIIFCIIWWVDVCNEDTVFIVLWWIVYSFSINRD